MNYLANAIMKSFEDLNEGDDYYLSEKRAELEDQTKWDSLRYIFTLDHKHTQHVANQLGVSVAELEAANRVCRAC